MSKLDDYLAQTGLSEADAMDVLLREHNLNVKSLLENKMIIDRQKQARDMYAAEVNRLQALNDEIRARGADTKEMLKELISRTL